MTEISRLWQPAQRYIGVVPFRPGVHEDDPEWVIGMGGEDDNPYGQRSATTPGSVVLRIVEVIDTKTTGRVAIYFRDFIDPDGRIVNAKRRRIGSLAAVRGYITRRGLKADEADKLAGATEGSTP